MKKFIITIIAVAIMGINSMFAAEFKESAGFYWTDQYATSNDEAVDLLYDYLSWYKGISNIELVPYKGKFDLDMRDHNVWRAYNEISVLKRTSNASVIKAVKKDVYIVFSFSNGKLTYGNCFTINGKN